jgi:hypothetical protein
MSFSARCLSIVLFASGYKDDHLMQMNRISISSKPPLFNYYFRAGFNSRAIRSGMASTLRSAAVG